MSGAFIRDGFVHVTLAEGGQVADPASVRLDILREVGRAQALLQHACGGTWEPVAGWSSRYRCSRCGAFGYRCAAVHGDAAGGIRACESIVAYCCATRGCGQPAVAKDKGKWRCGAHRRG